ncbi:neuropeptide S receptor-like isoform X2 [Ptychodera flava]|uniref:neuropeptide S receptor-like isoform X2 n=1 Tax=Ptychodera flava TaxID=63121 RepID=UPI00396A8C93
MDEIKYLPSTVTSINRTLYNQTWNSTATPPGNTAQQSVLSLHQTEQLITLWILFVFVVIGNSIVLVSVSLVRHKKSKMNFFIMNLAIADLLVGVFNIFPDIVHRYTVDFYGGDVICKLVRYLQATVVYASTYQLVALSLDRYNAIVHPMNFSGSDKRSTIMVVTMWVVAFILAIPSPIFFKETALPSGEVQCWLDLPNAESSMKPYTLVLACLLFFIPLIIITACYSIIIATIWQKSKDLVSPRRRPAKDQEKNGIYKSSGGISAKRSASSRGLIPKAKIKTIKMTLCIVVSFILCWSPFTLWIILKTYKLIPNNETTMNVHIIVQNLPSLNSATNPIIYGFFSTNICKELRRICSICVPCLRSPRSPKVHTQDKRRIPAINWIAAKLPCCEEWKPRGFGRSTTFRDTHYTDVSMTESPIPMSTKSDYNQIRNKEVLEGVCTSV